MLDIIIGIRINFKSSKSAKVNVMIKLFFLSFFLSNDRNYWSPLIAKEIMITRHKHY